MKTKELAVGLCAGLLLGALLTFAFSRHYVIETGGGSGTPVLRINTFTGKTWSMDQGQTGLYWKPFS